MIDMSIFVIAPDRIEFIILSNAAVNAQKLAVTIYHTVNYLTFKIERFTRERIKLIT